MKKYLALVLAVIFLLMSLSACQKDDSTGPDTESESESESESETVPEEIPVGPKDIVLSKKGKFLFTIIIPENAGTEIEAATQTLVSKLTKETGALIRMMDDATDDGEPEDSELEIIIGDCLRTDSQNALEGMGYNDYRIQATEKNIVIASRSEKATEDAIWKFISLLKGDNLIRDDENKTLSLRWESDIYLADSTKKIQNFTLGGKSIEEFRIVYPSTGTDKKVYLKYAQELRNWIGSNTGYVLDIVPDSEPAVVKEILIGKTSRTESTEYYSKITLENMQYAMSFKRGKLHLAGAMPFSTQYAVSMFEKMVKDNKGEIKSFDTGAVSMTETYRNNIGDYRFMEWNVLNSAWVDLTGSGLIPTEVSVRKEIVASMILGYSPDVISLCKFFDDWGRQLPEVIGNEYTFVEAKYLGSSNRSPIAYKTSRFELVASGVESIETYANVNNRCVTWAVLKDKETDQLITAFSTHYNPDSGDTGEADRLTQAEKTHDIVEQVTAQYGGAVVLMGDFNTTSGKSAYQLLASEYTDAFNGKGIDHIFYDPEQLTVVQTRTENGQFAENVSDHFPRIADVYVK